MNLASKFSSGNGRLMHAAFRLSFAMVLSLCTTLPVWAQVPELLGVGEFSGTATDLSPLTELLTNGEPHNRLGGFSALEYTGEANRYIALPDRGPDDGATGYICRYQLIEIDIQPGTPQPVQLKVLKTQQLSDVQGRPFTGDSRQFEATVDRSQRFDPEGVRLTGNGHCWISDEYGPSLIEFDATGRAIRSIALPKHLQILHPADSKKAENALNQSGRSSNKGMEGLAITPDGSMLVGLMQHVLLQDGEREDNGKPVGRNCRLVCVDIASGNVKEFVYRLDSDDNGLNEILAVSDSEFLVIERDGEPGDQARFKKIMRINLANATEVQHLDSLPHGALPDSIVPVQKEVFLDLLDPAYGLASANFPEKLEGLTFGPTLADGRQTLLVGSDNDFEADHPSVVYVFAIGDLAEPLNNTAAASR